MKCTAGPRTPESYPEVPGTRGGEVPRLAYIGFSVIGASDDVSVAESVITYTMRPPIWGLEILQPERARPSSAGS
jgi:hypothetical protein